MNPTVEVGLLGATIVVSWLIAWFYGDMAAQKAMEKRMNLDEAGARVASLTLLRFAARRLRACAEINGTVAKSPIRMPVAELEAALQRGVISPPSLCPVRLLDAIGGCLMTAGELNSSYEAYVQYLQILANNDRENLLQREREKMVLAAAEVVTHVKDLDEVLDDLLKKAVEHETTLRAELASGGLLARLKRCFKKTERAN